VCRTTAATRETYPLSQLRDGLITLHVIGPSFPLETILSGAYETTLGRLVFWLGGSYTEEDQIAGEVAREYAVFLEYTPWYEFPYMQALARLWTEASWWGPHVARKWERKIALSLGYGAKALYAGVMRWVTRTTYGVQDPTTYAVIAAPEPPSIPPEVEVVARSDDYVVLRLPRYAALVPAVVALAQEGATFLSLEGNNSIAASFLVPKGEAIPPAWGQEVVRLAVLSRPGVERVLVVLPVRRLAEVLRAAQHSPMQLDHVYDY
jgi:hypothetical protein